MYYSYVSKTSDFIQKLIWVFLNLGVEGAIFLKLNFCFSIEECRNIIMQFGVREVTAAQVARVLGMMARTHSGLTDGIPLQVSVAISYFTKSCPFYFIKSVWLFYQPKLNTCSSWLCLIPFLLFQSISAPGSGIWSDGKDKSDGAQAHTWNVEVLIDVLKELVSTCNVVHLWC